MCTDPVRPPTSGARAYPALRSRCAAARRTSSRRIRWYTSRGPEIDAEAGGLGDARTAVDGDRLAFLLGEQVGAADVRLAGDEQLVGREAGQDLAAVRGDDDLLFDPRRRAAVRGGAVRLEREHHSRFELDRVLERVDARDHRRLVQPDAEAVPELEPEAGFLALEAERLRGRPDGGDLVGRRARPDERDRGVEPLAALPVGVELRPRDRPDVERAVVARPVAHERVDDVEERLVARTQQAVGEDVRVRVAAVARDGVDRLDLLGAHLEQELLRARDDLVLVDARAEHAVDLLVDGVDEAGRLVEQRDLVRRLDLARLEHDARPVGHVQARALQRLEGHEVCHVDPERLAGEPALAQLVCDARAEAVGDAGLARHGAAHRRDARAEALRREPRREQLVVPRGGAEVPEDRVVAAQQQHEACVLVARPLADVRARDVADVVRVEEEESTELRRVEGGFRALEALTTEAREVDSLLPVDRARRVRRADRPASHRHRRTSWSDALRRRGKSAMRSSSPYPASIVARTSAFSSAARGRLTPAVSAASSTRSRSFSISAVVNVAE